MKRIPSNKFTIENHIGTLGYSLFSVWDWDNHKPQKHWTLIGWSKSENLPFRSKINGYAVMIEKDLIGERIWFHVRFRNQQDRIDYLNSL